MKYFIFKVTSNNSGVPTTLGAETYSMTDHENGADAVGRSYGDWRTAADLQAAFGGGLEQAKGMYVVLNGEPVPVQGLTLNDVLYAHTGIGSISGPGAILGTISQKMLLSHYSGNKWFDEYGVAIEVTTPNAETGNPGLCAWPVYRTAVYQKASGSTQYEFGFSVKAPEGHEKDTLRAYAYHFRALRGKLKMMYPTDQVTISSVYSNSENARMGIAVYQCDKMKTTSYPDYYPIPATIARPHTGNERYAMQYLGSSSAGNVETLAISDRDVATAALKNEDGSWHYSYHNSIRLRPITTLEDYISRWLQGNVYINS